MHRSFKLHHRRHTGKLIHHRHTSYLALVFVVIGAGLCMLLTDTQARAADLAVTATVPAPIPAGAPVFTMPLNGTTVEDPDVHFEGICPVIDPAVIIALYDGSDMIGSGVCQIDGTFAVDATVYEGTRSIVATVVTITGGTGESSTPLTITYTPPVPPVVPSPGTPTTPPITRANPRPVIRPDIKPLSILSEVQFIGFGVQTPGIWKGYFSGGITPYTVTIDWGDGDVQTYKDVGTDQQTYLHAYQAQHTFRASITLTDKDGRSLTRHIAAISFAPQKAPAGGVGSLIAPLATQSVTEQILRVAYLGLLVTSLWLWRYEVLKHRKVVAVPVHYAWQKARSHKPKRTPHSR